MRIGSRFAIGVHVLSLLAIEGPPERTSEWMAGSVGVNPVIIRNVVGQLRRAGLVRTRQGSPGAQLARPLSAVTLLDVYRAVEADGELFAIHPRPNPDCNVGANIQNTLEQVFGEAQRAMEDRLGAVTLADIVQDMGILQTV